MGDFWSNDNKADGLIIQCDVQFHARQLLLTREIMIEAKREYYDKNKTSHKPKVQSILLHLQRFQNDVLVAGTWEFSHLSDWKQVVVDRLDGSEKDMTLIEIAGKTKNTIEILRSKEQNSTLPIKSFKEIIQSGISWSIRRISYPHHKATNLIHYIERVVKELQGNSHILVRVEEYIKFILENTQDKKENWLADLAHNRSGLVKAGDLMTLIRDTVIESVRRTLALLLHFLEKRNSALSGLLSCETDKDRAIWLNVFLPKINSSISLSPFIPFSSMKWEPECLVVPSHCLNLRWAYSYIIMEQLCSLKQNFIELCAPEWCQDRIILMRENICLSFISENPLLCRLAESQLSTEHNNKKTLASCLEALWMKHSDDFSKDVQEIIAEKMIANEFGIGMDCIRALIGKSLALNMFSKHQHPADIVIHYWKLEPVLHSSLVLFMILPKSLKYKPTNDFVNDLITEASNMCITSLVESDSNNKNTHLATSKRCLNYGFRLCGDTGILSTFHPLLRKLQACVDFCTYFDFGNNDIAQRALRKLASSNYDMCIIDSIANDIRQYTDFEDNIDKFLCVCIIHDLGTLKRDSVNFSNTSVIESASKSLCKLLRNNNCTRPWKPGYLPPIIGI